MAGDRDGLPGACCVRAAAHVSWPRSPGRDAMGYDVGSRLRPSHVTVHYRACARHRRTGTHATRTMEERRMKRVLAIILGGGAGTRLYPLTKLRAKPAVPLGAKYRLIDIPISNCINSEIHRIYVLTQFNSASLNRHLARTYALAGAGFSPGFVEVLAAQQTPDSPSWFEGTADAVRQYLGVFAEWDVDQYLILSGDHLYRMNYADFIRHHREAKAVLTLGVVPVDARRASDFGLVRIDTQGRVRGFSEKPTGAALHAMQVDTTVLGLSVEQAQAAPYIASMGIYVFDKQVLHDLLTHAPLHMDFGTDLLPLAVSTYNVQAYLFQEYWEDIGTIEA